MNVIKYDCKSNEEWRHERAKSIGASAIGTILGLNPFCSPLQLAEKMRAELRGEFDYSQNLAMMRGHAYESGVATLFEWQTGHSIIKSSSSEYLLRRDDIPFMHASPDRTYWIDENGTKHGKNAEFNKGIVECKTTRTHIDPNNLPLSWVLQLQDQMGISGYHQGYLVWDSLTEADGFGFQLFEFDEDLFNMCVEACDGFWNNNVIGGVDPDPINADDIVAKYPKHITGKTITANNESLQLIANIKELKAAKKELDEELDNLTNQLKLQFTDEESMVTIDGKVVATFKASAGCTSVDSKKLESEYPDVYSQCIKVSNGSRSLLIK